MEAVPQSVLEAFAAIFATKTEQLTFFGGGQESSDGAVYAYPFENKRRLLKIMVIPEDAQRKALLALEERLKFVRFLGENGAPIVFPNITPQGNLYETFLFNKKLWFGYSMDRVSGLTRKERSWDAQFFKNWGETIGALHRLAQQYPSWQGAEDPESGELFLTWQEEWEDFYHWIQDSDVKEKWLGIKQQLDTLPVKKDSFGFIHNDPHIRNILVSGDRVTLLDFDVANHHWFINDIAVACQSILFFLSGGMSSPITDRSKLLNFLSLFMEGYSREHQLSLEWVDRLDLFIAYRRILLFTVMNDWIRSKHQLHNNWKQMILTQPEVVGAFS